jgi:hypothetical protein
MVADGDTPAAAAGSINLASPPLRAQAAASGLFALQLRSSNYYQR